MRIENEKTSKNIRSKVDRFDHVGKVRPASQQQQNFQDVLQEQSSAFLREKLEQLLQNLEEKGKQLVKTFSVYDLLAYKRLLQGFLGEVERQVYGLKEETSWSRSGRPKLFQRIELLNQELEELTEIVLDKQKDAVKLLKKLDSIRGLLIDLYS
ncbi:MAG: YaaR family protein [Clostridia bacterium]|jgi:uncharacterized protein YaaR (DUF327 family)|nr:YaaR family protein [Clostridia bacterium]